MVKKKNVLVANLATFLVKLCNMDKIITHGIWSFGLLIYILWLTLTVSSQIDLQIIFSINYRSIKCQRNMKCQYKLLKLGFVPNLALMREPPEHWF